MDDARRAVGVVVVNYGSADMVERNLAVLDELAGPRVIVVVDNFSTSEERARAVALCRRRGWVVATPDTNTGFGGGVNLGVRVAQEHGARDLLLVNPDARLLPGDVARLAAASASAGAGPVLCAPVVRRPDGRVWSAGLWLDEETGAIRRGDDPPSRGHRWLTGACLWVPEEAWAAIGGFDESYFLYWEDVDFCRRALEAGCELRVVADAEAVHEVGATQDGSARAKSPAYYYYNICNRGRYAAAHLGREDIRRWRRGDFASAREIVLRGGRQQFLRPWRVIPPVVRGLRDARRLTAAALRRR
ncbi:glycosyltransferase family 2 protein [Microbacterium sp.]|uniref:glycosyltransferase family 2 protein n=1 Tax=Microbacterium sp. TaxID=51671 RepID=UPI003A8774F3